MTDHEMLETVLGTLQQLVASQNQMQAAQEQMQAELRSVQAEVRRVAITQENVVLPKIQLIYESQANVIGKLKDVDLLQRKVSNLEDDVFVLKQAYKELKKAE